MNNINTDNILKRIREFKPRSFSDEPKGIKLNPIDIRYLRANIGFGVCGVNTETGVRYKMFGLFLVGDKNIEIGNCKIIGIPRMKKW